LVRREEGKGHILCCEDFEQRKKEGNRGNYRDAREHFTATGSLAIMMADFFTMASVDPDGPGGDG
jgi:hypothetical protein